MRDLRKRRFLTRYEVSLALKVDIDTVDEWENGENIPEEYLNKLAKIYKCTPEYILEAHKKSAPLPGQKISYTTITCPRCKSKNLAFVTEYHKALGLRALESFLQTFLWFLIIVGAAGFIIPALPTFEFNFTEFPHFIILTPFVYIAKKIVQHRIIVAESKIHIQSICKDCRHFWLHDDPYCP